MRIISLYFCKSIRIKTNSTRSLFIDCHLPSRSGFIRRFTVGKSPNDTLKMIYTFRNIYLRSFIFQRKQVFVESTLLHSPLFTSSAATFRTDHSTSCQGGENAVYVFFLPSLWQPLLFCYRRSLMRISKFLNPELPMVVVVAVSQPSLQRLLGSPEISISHWVKLTVTSTLRTVGSPRQSQCSQRVSAAVNSMVCIETEELNG